MTVMVGRVACSQFNARVFESGRALNPFPRMPPRSWRAQVSAGAIFNSMVSSGSYRERTWLGARQPWIESSYPASSYRWNASLRR
jgi:hypothetical protein